MNVMPQPDILTSLKVTPVALTGKSIFINGQFVVPSTKEQFRSTDPTTGKTAIELPDGNAEDVDKAVKAAYRARLAWASLPPEERAQKLECLAKLVEDNAKKLAIIESFDVGKGLEDSEDDMMGAATQLRNCAGYCRDLVKMQGSAIAIGCDNFTSRRRYEPFGVMGLIIPWNYPLAMAVQKVAPALAAGNTCVLKPSEVASLTSIEFADLVRQAEIPCGVFNLVTGLGPTTGMALVKHPLVRKISFTGSVKTGQEILRNAAESIKPVSLELGGKSPMIVFEDVNRESVTNWILSGILSGCGQVCCATSRVLIHQSIYKDMCERLKRGAEKVTIGRFYDKPAPLMGPLVSAVQHQRVLNYLEIARSEGLTVLTGGTNDRPSHLDEGFFVQPTICVDVPSSSKLWKEEIFGPVLCLRSFVTEEEALEEANNTTYGLAAAVMVKDEKRRERLANLLEAGTVWENCSLSGSATTPFGGYKMSGFGKECGMEGFMECLQMKVITSCSPDFPKTYV